MNANVKKALIKSALLLVTAVFSYANDMPPPDNPDNVPFSRVQRMDWNLAEVKSGSADVIIDRTNAQRETYSLRFEADLVRGRGAGNIYFARYTSGANNALSIQKIAGTYMVPLFEMENFTEYEYFRYLERVNHWEFHDWRLKLYTCDENGGEVVLEFIPIYK